jgi:hypothetical protein
MTISINGIQHSTISYAKCDILFTVMLEAIFRLSVKMLNVVLLSVVVPIGRNI